MLRDSIDYKGTAVGKLFRRLFFPTAMGMVFSAVFVITLGGDRESKSLNSRH